MQLLLFALLPLFASADETGCLRGAEEELEASFLQLNTEVQTTDVHLKAAAGEKIQQGQHKKTSKEHIVPPGDVHEITPTGSVVQAAICILVAPGIVMGLLYIWLACKPEPKTPHLDAIVKQADVKPEKLSGNSFPEMLYQKATDANWKHRLALRVWSEGKGIEQRMTYEELAAAVEAGADTLAQAGVSRGDRVSFFCKGTLDFYIALLAVETLGATPVLLNWRQSPENLKGMMEDSGSTFLIFGALHDSREAVVTNMPQGLSTVILIDGKLPPEGKCRVQQWSCAAGPGGAFTKLSSCLHESREAEAAVFFTSGSTSRPKPVLHTYESLIWTAENFVFPENTESTLSFLPNFHVIMTLQNFLIPLARGICAAVHGADDSQNITAGMLLKATAALSPSVIDTVPFIMEEWSLMSRTDLEPLTRCALVQSGGAPLSTAVAERLLAAGVPVRQHYGQTESPGIQLATVPGAAPSELSIFQPPWKMAKPVLDGEEEGELIIQGIGNSAPGNLFKGSLVANSSKMEPGVGHRTGDVFRWTKTASGQPGLIHCMRTDDTLLLSTGEMFNPVPMEKSVANFAQDLQDVQVSQVAVLGKNRPAPLLVVELADDKVADEQKVLAALQPGIDAANQAEVEYARIKQGYVVVLIPGKSKQLLPKTAKGNFIRGQSEKLMAPILDKAEAQAKEAQLEQLKAKALAAGYADVQEYLASAGSAELKDVGVDSLGVKMEDSTNLTDITRISDNVKGMICGTVLVYHWYVFVRSPLLDIDAVDMLKGFTFSASVQDAATQSSLSFLTSAMWTFFLAFGIVDGMQDGPERKLAFFSSRTYACFFVLFIFKFIRVFITVGDVASTAIDGHSYQSEILGDVWFINLMLYYRAIVRLMQLCRIPPPFQVIIASVPISQYFFEYAGSVTYLPVPSTWPSLQWLEIYLLDVSSFTVPSVLLPFLPTSLRNQGFLSTFGMSLGNFSQDYTRCSFWCGLFDFYGLAHVLAFYYGEDVVMWMLRLQERTEHKVKTYLGSTDRVRQMKSVAALVFAALAFGMQVALSTWAARHGCPASWQGLCLVLQLIFVFIAAFFAFMAAVASPWHSKRIGPSTLGLYVLHRFFPFFTFGWLLDISDAITLSKLSALPGIAAVQVATLIVWPWLFCYMFGPALQWLILTPVTALMNASTSRASKMSTKSMS
mmetsp:Transcript_12224/g.21710  ORF Transcript_12224/g.21710 Transcript_12224/m.21710 type:complete len:1178 (+) Transcript_12224:59-3592(+)